MAQSEIKGAEDEEIVGTGIGPGEEVPTDLYLGESRVFLDPVIAPTLAPVVALVLAPVVAPDPLPHQGLQYRRICRRA